MCQTTRWRSDVASILFRWRTCHIRPTHGTTLASLPQVSVAPAEPAEGIPCVRRGAPSWALGPGGAGGGRRPTAHTSKAVGSGTGRSKVSLPAASREKIAECTLDAHGALQFQGRIWAQVRAAHDDAHTADPRLDNVRPPGQEHDFQYRLQTSVDSMTNLPVQDESPPRYMMVIIDRL